VLRQEIATAWVSLTERRLHGQGYFNNLNTTVAHNWATQRAILSGARCEQSRSCYMRTRTVLIIANAFSRRP
jgi:hypothetical protein